MSTSTTVSSFSETDYAILSIMPMEVVIMVMLLVVVMVVVVLVVVMVVLMAFRAEGDW